MGDHQQKIKEAAKLIASARRLAVLTGAGVSSESGVPTFRGQAGEPVWKEFWDASMLSNPRFLRSNPKEFWEWMQYRRKIIENCQPNAAHKVISGWQKKWGSNFRLITTNVDGLHRRAGSENLIELHGSLWRVRGIRCTHKSELLSTEQEVLPPLCPVCGHPVRPEVVLFHENLNEKDLRRAQLDVSDADVLIVVGSANLVFPAAGLPIHAHEAGAKVIVVNPVETNVEEFAAISLRGRAAEVLPELLVSSDSRYCLQI